MKKEIFFNFQIGNSFLNKEDDITILAFLRKHPIFKKKIKPNTFLSLILIYIKIENIYINCLFIKTNNFILYKYY